MHIGCMCSTAWIFLKKMSLTEAQCDTSITIDSLTFFIFKVLFMHSHNKGNCFCSSPFARPFYGCLCKQKSEIPSGVLGSGKFFTATTRHPCMLLQATSKTLCTFFLKYKLKVLGIMEENAWK